MNDLYQSIVNYDYGCAERAVLMEKVWKPTPWVVNAFVGDDERRQDVRCWLRDTFGQESSPIHDLQGDYHTGSATINGWEWIGFKTEHQMQQFIAAWPAED